MGLTENCCTSVSPDSPHLLVSISNTAGFSLALRQASHFAIDVLHIGQQPASNCFARKSEDGFAATAWQASETRSSRVRSSAGGQSSRATRKPRSALTSRVAALRRAAGRRSVVAQDAPSAKR
ncbi:flavin reductase family protein [Novosphingobium sp. Gsoil 351]|uniref:flavin reductase family protein n=1 Tax=Novosphingobium sp. Gsoil 351 TaxID=2675225 RepID=UPI001E5E76A5|nr:flavin reductase family protein [Novosphingobium sp. Gsoil 351]